MKDILQDIISHTHSLGFLPTIKVATDTTTTSMAALAEDKSVIFNAETHSRISEFEGIFGLSNLSVLSLHLKNPEYQTDATIEVVKKTKNGEDYPAHIHFENVLGDFQNDFRFVNKDIIEQQVKNVKFKGAAWDVEFEPPVASITRMKLMATSHPDETNFTFQTEGNNLIVLIGDDNNHAGKFVFKHNVTGTLTTPRVYPLHQIQSILSLSGNQTISISNQGIMKISVDSGLARYDYILPAQSK